MRRGYELHLELVGCLLPSSIIIGLASLGVNYPPTHTALLLFYEETSESLGPANAADSFFCPFFFSRALLYCACRRAIHEHREANQSSCIIDWRVLAPAAISAKPGPRPSAWRYARRTSTKYLISLLYKGLVFSCRDCYNLLGVSAWDSTPFLSTVLCIFLN